MPRGKTRQRDASDDDHDTDDDERADAGSGENDDTSFDGKSIGFFESIMAMLPWTEAGRQADYADERLNAIREMQAEHTAALRLHRMVRDGKHERALEELMADTEGQMYHDFHRHRCKLEKTGEWTFVSPTERRRLGKALQQSEDVLALRQYMAHRRDRFLRIR
ncbi:unnamed protein product [Phaeothamnion confervicola]